ncbi:hypothetical protein EUGRSUZ_E02579 [Eucalyptus grandis]|uniref:Uncharacterized protein n=2 Tax=Eucalyptus grandis TaxID=71139 RepID=A0ACC3KZ82_EUCGR|nr:hypothetical protein EUGRSUZ_E02579 [Eucalyptus grandis]
MESPKFKFKVIWRLWRELAQRLIPSTFQFGSFRANSQAQSTAMELGKQRGQSRNKLKSYIQECSRIQNELIQLWASSMSQQRPQTASSDRPQKLNTGYAQSRGGSPKQ